MLSEAVPVGEATWYINGAAVQPDDSAWSVTVDGCQHALLLHSAQSHHAGEVTFAAHDAVASARLSVLSEWLAGVPPQQVGSGTSSLAALWVERPSRAGSNVNLTDPN
jgi:obscurin-RhoGEF protein